MLHNFSNDLKHEREQTVLADKFYLEVLKASEIKRFSSDSEEDMIMQKQDVDLLLTMNGTTFRVSEKFRDKDFGDMYIEVYSKFPKVKGWLNTGSPNAILYFTPKNVYWITHLSLKEFCIQKLFPQIITQWFEELYNSGKTIIGKRISIDQNTYSINIIQAHNKDGNEWKTMGVSVPFDLLKNAGVKFKRFDALV